jgi:hypothetical protein
MIWRKVISAFISCSCLSSSTPAKEAAPDRWPPVSPSAIVPAQGFDKTVVPITELKLLGLGREGEFGTGFCLDPTCRFIATNYHVAMMARPCKITGEKIVQLYLATGPDDEGATVNDSPSVRPLKYHSQSRPGHLRTTLLSASPSQRSFQSRRSASWPAS